MEQSRWSLRSIRRVATCRRRHGPVVALLTDTQGRPLPLPSPLDLTMSDSRSILRTLSAAERRTCSAADYPDGPESQRWDKRKAADFAATGTPGHASGSSCCCSRRTREAIAWLAVNNGTVAYGADTGGALGRQRAGSVSSTWTPLVLAAFFSAGPSRAARTGRRCHGFDGRNGHRSVFFVFLLHRASRGPTPLLERLEVGLAAKPPPTGLITQIVHLSRCRYLRRSALSALPFHADRCHGTLDGAKRPARIRPGCPRVRWRFSAAHHLGTFGEPFKARRLFSGCWRDLLRLRLSPPRHRHRGGAHGAL